MQYEDQPRPSEVFHDHAWTIDFNFVLNLQTFKLEYKPNHPPLLAKCGSVCKTQRGCSNVWRGETSVSA